jgi:hypothetical protein
MLGRSAAPGLVWVSCLLLSLGVFASPAEAQYGGGIGTAEKPHLIFTAEQLDFLVARPQDWGKHFKLMADIDLKAWGVGEPRVIGTIDDGPFTGVFDGNHKILSNLHQVPDFGGYLGLFGLVEGLEARIENLTLADPHISSETGRYVGALVGSLREGMVSNCHVRAGGVLGMSFVGGLVGRNDGGLILGCTVDAVVQGASRVGGLVGQSYYGTVERCRAQGQVLGLESSYWIGGLIGEGREVTVRECRACCSVRGDLSVGGLLGENLSGTIERSCAGGVVRGGTYAGGLLGLNSGGTVRDCYATADVKATIYVGGLAGCNEPDCHCIVYVPGLIARSYACGPVWGVNAGGLVGINDKSQTVTSFWNRETTGCAVSAGGNGKSDLEMCRLSMYLAAGWDFVGEKANGSQDIWYLPAEGGPPRLAWELAEGDLNDDGRIDFRDFGCLAAQWRQTSAAGSAGFHDLMGLAELWLAGRK